jgi:hypothetical protein
MGRADLAARLDDRTSTGFRRRISPGNADRRSYSGEQTRVSAGITLAAAA